MKRLWLAVCLLSLTGCSKDPVTKEIAEIEAMAEPQFDTVRMDDFAYRESFNQQMIAFHQEHNARIEKLYKQFPQNADVWKLMIDRWLNMAHSGQIKDLDGELAPMLQATTDSGRRADLLYILAESCAWVGLSFESDKAAVDDFLQAAPEDERGAELLFNLGRSAKRVEDQLQVFERAAAKPYTDTMYGMLAKSNMVQVAGIGKPFELAFNDLISGKPISITDFKGKIVVVDFWATWCGPCIASMPENNRLCADYKDRGVEFVGVTLDSPDAKSEFKDCIAQHKITWPQFFQENGLESAFSSKWEIRAVPAVFVIDREGNLATTMAAGKLQYILDEMLRKEAAGKSKAM